MKGVLGDMILRVVGTMETQAIQTMVSGVKPMSAIRQHGLMYNLKSKEYRRVKQTACMFYILCYYCLLILHVHVILQLERAGR